MELTQFFDRLSPRLKAARDLDSQLDRRLAHRFNVFDYLKDDELGLSRIIADLLDPEASHGQGTLFLKLFLGMEGLKHRREWPEPGGSQIPVVVTRERRTSSGRKIDITVQIGNSNKNSYCLAIENKPYDDDRPNQVKDYLDYLKGEYCDRFLLIYIPPTGQGPSEESITKRELEKWKEEFAIMPYCEGPEGPEDNFFDDFRIRHSVADWLKECQRNCEVDQLRWFLRHAEIFCRRRFGGQPMTTSAERKCASDFVFLTPGHLKTALAVYESWPDIVDRVCKRFLANLRSRIESSVKEHEDLKLFAGDMRFGANYRDRARAWESSLWLYRESWTPYPLEKQGNGRTRIQLENASPGPKNWGIGVRSPIPETEMSRMDDKFRKQRKCLDDKLEGKFRPRGKRTDQWPRWLTLPAEKTNWDALVLDLHQENENKDGEYMRYFVDQFVEVAAKAIPIINHIEGPKGDN